VSASAQPGRSEQSRPGEHTADKCHRGGYQRGRQEYVAENGQPGRYRTQSDRKQDDAAEPADEDGGEADSTETTHRT
jgi:hypothetical protein